MPQVTQLRHGRAGPGDQPIEGRPSPCAPQFSMAAWGQGTAHPSSSGSQKSRKLPLPQWASSRLPWPWRVLARARVQQPLPCHELTPCDPQGPHEASIRLGTGCFTVPVSDRSLAVCHHSSESPRQPKRHIKNDLFSGFRTTTQTDQLPGMS